MTSRNQKTSRLRAIALAAGVGVLGSLAFTSTSLAAAPTAGTACQVNGKISGRGATFQTIAQQALADGYRIDVCGPVAPQFAGDPAGTNMIAYNYPSAVASSATGSGNGRAAASCRTDAFAGTDNPYSTPQLGLLRGAPGAQGPCTYATPLVPPYSPSGPFPAPNDITPPTTPTSGVMSFPIAGAAVAIGANLQPTVTCAAPPTTLRLTSSTASRLFGGKYKNWNDPELVTLNPDLAACNKQVIRGVRLDNSGTTTTFKNYLRNADNNRPTQTCDPVVGTTNTWGALANQSWPGAPTGSVTGETATCSALTRPGLSGGDQLVALVDATDGAVGYADLADWNALVPAAEPVVLADVQAALGGAFVPPINAGASNCSFAGASQPGSNAADSVGLNATLTWANDLTGNNQKADLTFRGTGYPICGFTWVLVYTGLNGNSGANNAITGLTANQRRTLFSYFTYVSSPAAQSRLGAAGYAPLPNSFLNRQRAGFQNSF